MELLKDKHPDLQDCEASIKFCRRIKSLITAMNSRTPFNSLKPGNEMWENIKSFLDFLLCWETVAEKQNYELIISSTLYGLKISLQGALEICKFLVEECNFKYVITDRLNQDNLERFFGMMRNCCGSNDHPDSALFIQMFRLVSTYSLVKPPKGCNISGGDIVISLMNIKDVQNLDDRQQQWDAKIDSILDKGLHTNVLSKAAKIMEEHEYFQYSTSDYVLAGYVAGFVARKGNRFARTQIDSKTAAICDDCIASLKLLADEKVSEQYCKLIRMRSRGNLCEPSMKLFELITALEIATLKVVNTGCVESETLFKITAALEDWSPLPLVGCNQHSLLFTRRIVSFYLTTRMFFLTKQANKNDGIEKEKTKEKRKLSKLSYAANNDENIALQTTASVLAKKRKNQSIPKCSVTQPKKSKN